MTPLRENSRTTRIYVSGPVWYRATVVMGWQRGRRIGAAQIDSFLRASSRLFTRNGVGPPDFRAARSVSLPATVRGLLYRA